MPTSAPDPNSARKYLAVFGCALVIGLGCIGTLNAVVDPFRVYRLGLVDDLDRYKLEVSRVLKSNLIVADDPATVILGSSRIVRSIDTEHPAWTDRPVINAALGGTNATEIGGSGAASSPAAPVGTRRVEPSKVQWTQPPAPSTARTDSPGRSRSARDR